MKSLISYFIRYPITADVLVMLILIFGYFGLNNMRSTFFPETDTKVIQIQTVYPGASPEEVEEGIVAKIEDNLRGTTGVERITSVSKENSGQITVEIKRGYDIDVVLQDVKNAVDQIGSFPTDMEAPVIFKAEVLTVALNFAISGDTDLRTLKRFAREIENDLLATDGISKVALSGFPEEEIEISVREDVLRAYQMTFDQLVQAVRSSNLELTGGTIKTDAEELLIRSRNKGYYAEDLLDVVVATAPDGRKVYLKDIAKVVDRWADNPNRTYVNGRPAVGINVSNTIDENLLDISEQVRAYVDQFNAENEVVKAVIINDGSEILQQRVDLLSKNGVIGFFLVLFFLAMFLKLRLAFWVAIAIPISFMGMFVVASLLGVSINVITLFGMILVIGILVDDGIVISENIYQQWENGKEPLQAAIDGTMEVLPAVFGAIITTMVAFGTFLFLDGITGDFFGELSIVVILTLAFSLIEGALILPAHIAHSKALHREEADKATDPEQRSLGDRIAKGFEAVQQKLWDFMDWMKIRLYAPSLRFFMENTFLGVAIPLGFLLISFGLVGGGFVKTTFFPFVEGDFIAVNLKMPAGTREHITEQWLDHIEQAAWEVNEEYKAIRPDGLGIIRLVNQNLGPSTYEGNLLIRLLDTETRNMPGLEISDAIRQKAGEIIGAEQVTYAISTPFGKAVSVALIGSNLEELASAADALKSEMLELADLRDITDSNQEGLREIDVKLKEKARLLGLSLQDVVGQVRQGFFGAEIQRLQRGLDEVKVWVRYDESDRSSVGKLENMRIRTQGGGAYPLSELAELKVGRGIISINRLDGEREIRVEADLADADVSATEMIATVETELLPPILEKYSSVRYSLEGQVRENGKTQKSAGLVLPIALFMILVIIILTFRSINQTIAVLAIIPFGAIGVIFGHFLFGKAISVLSGLGIFALIGIMVNDALVLVSSFNILVAEGKDFKEALYEASVSRFRPILLTSLTTIAGLGPLIFERSFQAQFLVPMAISVAFGLAAATLIILILLPVLLVIFNRYKTLAVWLWEGERPPAIMVEPAHSGRKNYLLLWMILPLSLVALLFLISQFL